MVTDLVNRPTMVRNVERDVLMAPRFVWSVRDEDAEERCERDVERPASWVERLRHWLIEYNRY